MNSSHSSPTAIASTAGGSANAPYRGRPDPETIVHLATAYWDSIALLALNEMGVFNFLSNDQADLGKKTEQVAQALEVDCHALGLLLNAGVALGLLIKDQSGRFKNSPMAASWLVEGLPGYLGGAFKYALDMLPAWVNLPRAVKSGEPQTPDVDYLGGDPELTRRYVRGMYSRGMAVATHAIEAIQLPAHASLLDIAGGSGVFSILLCGMHGGITSVVADLPPVVNIAREIVMEHDLADRIGTMDLDITQQSPTGSYDAVLVSGLLHRFRASDCKEIVAKASRCLKPGGTLILVDVMLEDNHAEPRFATLFALNMMLSAKGGGAHSIGEHVGWLEDAGLQNASTIRLPLTFPETVVQAWLPPYGVDSEQKEQQ